MARYWIAVACREHVARGVSGGFTQVCHGKAGPLERMSAGDGIIYYSPTIHFGGKDLCQSFTALGTINPGKSYTVVMSEDFIPWRRDVTFISSKEVAIRPLLEKLTFIKDKKHWGYFFRFGCFEIPQKDFELIAQYMNEKS